MAAQRRNEHGGPGVGRRATKDIDLASLEVTSLEAAEGSLCALVAAELGDHLGFRLIRSVPIGLNKNQPGLATRRSIFACIDLDHDAQIDTVQVDVVVASLIDPALDTSSGASQWNPETLTWSPTEDDA